MKIYEQITEELWCRGAAPGKDDHKDAKCIMNWIRHIYPADQVKEIREKIIPIINDPLVILWNDYPGRKFSEVFDALKKADI